MINVRCFKCGWFFTVDEKALAEQQGEENPRHYVVECPRCRQVNKIPARQVRVRRAGRGKTEK